MAFFSAPVNASSAHLGFDPASLSMGACDSKELLQTLIELLESNDSSADFSDQPEIRQLFQQLHQKFPDLIEDPDKLHLSREEITRLIEKTQRHLDSADAGEGVETGSASPHQPSPYDIIPRPAKFPSRPKTVSEKPQRYLSSLDKRESHNQERVKPRVEKTLNLDINAVIPIMDAANLFDAHQDELILAINADNDLRVRQLATLNDLIATLRTNTNGEGDSARVQLPENKRHLIEDVRAFAPEIVNAGIFAFEGKAKINEIQEAAERKQKELMLQISPNYTKIEHHLKDKDHVFELAKIIVEQYSKLMSSINHKTAQK